MKHTKQMLTAGLLTATVVGGGIFALSASAATDSDSSDSLAQKIATKFNLNKDDVQTIVNEHRSEKRAEHREEHKERQTERLTQAVKDGKITEDQKTKILDYVESQRGFFDDLKDKTREERKAALEAHRAEVEKWAKDNGIDLQYLRPGGFGGHHGHGEMMRGGDRGDNI